MSSSLIFLGRNLNGRLNKKDFFSIWFSYNQIIRILSLDVSNSIVWHLLQ